LTSHTYLPPSLKMKHLWPAADLAELAKTRTIKRRKPSDYWKPQLKQRELLEACGLLAAYEGGAVTEPAAELIGYGGAAFGGKTEGLIGIGLVASMMIPGVQIGFFRRTFPELEGADGPIDRSLELFTPTGGHYNKTEHAWRWPNLAAMRFCHCQHEANVYQYQSWAFDILLIDEATHFSWFIIDYLLTRNRASKVSKIVRPFCVMCTNPGGIGHSWYMQLFGIDGDGYYQADYS
jgi:hypothetical protein